MSSYYRAGVLLSVALSLFGCRADLSVPETKIVERTHLGVSCSTDVAHHTRNGALVIDQYFGEQCDRVGLALWLKKEAVAVDAWLATRPIKLHAASPNSTGNESAGPSTSTYFVGFRHPAGFNDGRLKIGKDAPLSIRVVLTDRTILRTSVKLPCCGGWG